MKKSGRNMAITLVCLILGVMIAWQYRSIDINKAAEAYENRSRTEILEMLYQEQKDNQDRRSQISKLQRDLSEYQNAKGSTNDIVNKLKKDLQEAKTIAGLTEVQGEGVVITLKGTASDRVHDTALIDMVNELRASDAQAISINEQRVIAMTEIRDAGAYIVINGIQLGEPFTIKAIGERQKLLAGLNMIGGAVYRMNNDYFLEVVQVKEEKLLTIPAVADDGTIIHTNHLKPVTK